jgi:transposase
MGMTRSLKIIRLTTTTAPPNASTHWSTNTMAALAGVSPSTVGKIWRTFGLKPHMVETFTYVKRSRVHARGSEMLLGSISTLLKRRSNSRVDEKTQIQALKRTQPMLPMVPGVPLRRTPKYKRNGISNLYAALDVASGKVITKMTVAKRAVEFISVLRAHRPTSTKRSLRVHVVLDNYLSHKTESVRTWLLRHLRFVFHFTPTYSSWMNQVERWFAALTTKYLQRSVHHPVTELNRAITKWAKAWNENPKPFIWTKSADEIFASMQKYLEPIVSPQTSQEGH